MKEKCEEECILLAVVVSDEVDGFEVPHERICHRQHVPDQPRDVLLKTLDNLVLLARVRHEVVLDHATFNERFHIELFFENRLNQRVLLCRAEALVLRAARIPERQRLVLVLQLHFQILALSLLVQEDVVEEYKHDDLFLREEGVSEDPVVLVLLAELQALELVDEHITPASISHEEVVCFAGPLRRRVELL